MAIKVSLGKLVLDFDLPFAEASAGNCATMDSVLSLEVAQVAVIPFHHRDPFDRLIVAQALVERIPVVGWDPAFDPYGPNEAAAQLTP